VAEHGTRQCYSQGCRLPECKAAQAEYVRGYKARKAGAVVDIRRPGRPRKGEASPAPIAAPEMPAGGGPNEQAVRAELANLSSASVRLASAAAAVSMAKILDSPLALAQQPAAATRLEAIMSGLRQGSQKRKGRLASVQAMTTKVKPDSAAI